MISELDYSIIIVLQYYNSFDYMNQYMNILSLSDMMIL